MIVVLGKSAESFFSDVEICCRLSLPYYVAPDYPYSSNNTSHYFGLALGILKPCLTTINNLSSPVRKLDGQVMKITYDIVDEEE